MAFIWSTRAMVSGTAPGYGEIADRRSEVHLMVLRRVGVAAVVAALVMAGMTVPSGADHAWGRYHWARSANPFTLQLGDNVDSTWAGHLTGASADWSVSTVLDTQVVAGGSDPRRCKATSGRVEVCNAAYGFNGWLGIAQISVSGDHITAGVVKVNDSYFDTVTYNTPAWRRFVMCQEIGHTFGLGHQDEVFDNPNLGTCMDYTSDPSTNQAPNAHDFEQLETIYTHLDSSGGGGGGSGNGRGRPSAAGQGQSEWGRSIRTGADGRPAVYVQDNGSERVFTFVTWVS